MFFHEGMNMTEADFDVALTKSHGEKWAAMFQLKRGNVCKNPAQQYAMFQDFLEEGFESDKNWIAYQPIRPALEGADKSVSFAEALLRNNGFNEHGAPAGVFGKWTQDEKSKFMRWEIDQCIEVAKRTGIPISVNCEDIISDEGVLKMFGDNPDLIHMEVLETAKYTPDVIKDLNKKKISLYLDDFPETHWGDIEFYAPHVLGIKFDYKLCLCVLDVEKPYVFPSHAFSAVAVFKSPECKDYLARLEELKTKFFRTVQNAIKANPDVHIVFECTFDPVVVRELMAHHLQLDTAGVDAIMKQVYMQGADSMAAGFVPKYKVPSKSLRKKALAGC